MSKIGTAVADAMDRTGKEAEELTEEEVFYPETSGDRLAKALEEESHPAHSVRRLLDRDMNSDDAFELGIILWDLASLAHRLNAFRGDLSPVKEDLDLSIAKLTKIAGRIK